MEDWRSEKSTLSSKVAFYWEQNVESLADVIFVVGREEVEIKAFKLLLSVNSPVFETMFSETWSTARGQDTKIELPYTNPTVFRHFLKIMCKDDKMEQDLARVSMPLVVGIYLMSKEYLVNNLKSKCEKLMRRNMGVDNVLEIYDQINGKDEAKLEKEAFDFLRLNLEKVLEQPNFLTISKQLLLSILRRNDVCVDELKLFTAVCRWGKCTVMKENEFVSFEDKENKRRMMRECLSEIRLPLFSTCEFADHVRPTGLLYAEESLLLYDYISRTNKRSSSKSTLILSNNLTVKTGPRLSTCLDKFIDLYIVDNNTRVPCNGVWTSGIVTVIGIGFCGPVSEDSMYEVNVWTDDKLRAQNREIFAKKGSMTIMPLSVPIEFAANTWICINFNLLGPSTGGSPLLNCEGSVTKDNISFYFY